MPQLKIGVYVDVENIHRSGGYGMSFSVLREFACRGEGIPMRLNAYVAHDEELARADHAYRTRQESFHMMLREQGYKVVRKAVKWYSDGRGGRIAKANSDLDLAVDALLQSEKLDRILLVTGDGDFVQVVAALQNKGCRVEVVGFDNVSSELRSSADMFFSGYLIPGLLPVERSDRTWGAVGSRVRGTCYYYNHSKGFGFFRFMREISSNLWDLDSRKAGSPYGTSYFHATDLPEGTDASHLPNRSMIFDFILARTRQAEEGFVAEDIVVLGREREQERQKEERAPEEDENGAT